MKGWFGRGSEIGRHRGADGANVVGIVVLEMHLDGIVEGIRLPFLDTTPFPSETMNTCLDLFQFNNMFFKFAVTNKFNPIPGIKQNKLIICSVVLDNCYQRQLRLDIAAVLKYQRARQNSLNHRNNRHQIYLISNQAPIIIPLQF